MKKIICCLGILLANQTYLYSSQTPQNTSIEHNETDIESDLVYRALTQAQEIRYNDFFTKHLHLHDKDSIIPDHIHLSPHSSIFIKAANIATNYVIKKKYISDRTDNPSIKIIKQANKNIEKLILQMPIDETLVKDNLSKHPDHIDVAMFVGLQNNIIKLQSENITVTEIINDYKNTQKEFMKRKKSMPTNSCCIQ